MKKSRKKKASVRRKARIEVEGGVYVLDYRLATEQFHKQLVTKVLSEEGGNISEAARKLGVSRRTLQLQTTKLQIDVDSIRNGGSE